MENVLERDLTSSTWATQTGGEQLDGGVAWKGPVSVVDRNKNGRVTTQARRHLAPRSTDDINDSLSDEALGDRVTPTEDEMKYVLGDAEFAIWIEQWKRGKEFISMRKYVQKGHTMTGQERQQFELDKAAYSQASLMEHTVTVELCRRGEAREAMVESEERRRLKAKQQRAEKRKPKRERYQQLKPRVMTGEADEAELQEYHRLAKELNYVYEDEAQKRKQRKANKENLIAELEGKEVRTVLQEGQLARLKHGLKTQAERKKAASQSQYQKQKAAAAERVKQIETLKQMKTRTQQQDEEIAKFELDQEERRRKNRNGMASRRRKKERPQSEKTTDSQKLDRIDSSEQLDLKSPKEEEEPPQLNAEVEESEWIPARNRQSVRKDREEKETRAPQAQQSQPRARITTSDASKQPTPPSTSQEEKKKKKTKDPPVQQFAIHPLPSPTTISNLLRKSWNYLSHAELGMATALRNALREAGPPLRAVEGKMSSLSVSTLRD
ncbi:MAG: hypothetical protein M1826_004604 [Phylliscum demangeonii]|nr:MAG: hypothetical protein M1826_004604 [Phylliscum demangeonii]